MVAVGSDARAVVGARGEAGSTREDSPGAASLVRVVETGTEGSSKANGRAGYLLWAAMLNAGFAGQDAAPDVGLANHSRDGYVAVCAPPLNLEDRVLDESTDPYLPAASRAKATAAAIDLAVGLTRIRLGQPNGHFAEAYDSRVGDIERLASKHAETDLATSAEIRSLKRVRAALYADAIGGLRALVADAPSRRLLEAYQAHESVLDGVLRNLASAQLIRGAERRAVCEVLNEAG